MSIERWGRVPERNNSLAHQTNSQCIMQNDRFQTQYWLQSSSNSKATCRVSLTRKPCMISQQIAPRINILNSKILRCKGTKCQNCGTMSFKTNQSWLLDTVSWVTNDLTRIWALLLTPGAAQLKSESSFHSNQYKPSHWFGKCLISCYFLPSLEKNPSDHTIQCLF